MITFRNFSIEDSNGRRFNGHFNPNLLFSFSNPIDSLMRFITVFSLFPQVIQAMYCF